MNSKPLFTSVLLIRIPVLLALAAGGVLVPHARAADGSWNVNAAGNWASAGSWLSSTIPGATSGTTSTDIATFGFTLTGARIVTVDTGRNIGGITFSNTSAFGYTLSGGTLILSNGGVIQTAAANGAHTDTISTGMTLAGNATFMANASNASSLLSIAAVTGSATTGNTATLTLNGSNTGNNSITGIIGNGAGGGKLAIVKSDAGTWRLSGVNTFTGGLTLNSGTLQLGDNAALGGSGNVFTINGGVINVTAARTTTNNNAQNWNGDFTFLGSNTLNLGTGAVAMNATRTVTVNSSNLTVGGVISGSGFGLTKAGAGTLTLSGANTFTGPVTINSGTLTVTSAIGNGSVAGGLGQATNAASNLVINGGTFNWNAAATATSDRGITIGTNGGTIFANGSGGSAGLRLTGPLALAGSGPRTITLVSVANSRENTWSADIGDSGGATTLAVNNTTASNTSSWMLNGNLTFTGGLSVGGGGGTLYLRGNQNNFSGGVSVGAGSALYFTNNNTMTFSQDVSNNGTFGFSGQASGVSTVNNNSGAIITISGLISGNGSVSHAMNNNGRIIQSNPSNSYTGSTTTAASSITLTLEASKLANGGQNSSIGASSSAAGNLVLGSNTSPGTSILDYVGTGDSTDRLFTIKSNSGGGAGIYNNGSGALNFTNTGSIAFGTANMAATFFLGGSSAHYNTFAPILNNNGSGVVSLTKSGAGTWVLTGANTYTGNTTISVGTLVFQNTSAKSSGSNVTVAAGANLGLGVGNASIDYSNHAANIFNNNGNGTFTLNATSGIALDTTNGNFTLSTALTANRALTKLGANTLTLNATNTYASATTINGGTLSIAAITNGGVAGALGNSTNAAGNLVLGGGTLEYTGSGNSTDRNFTLTAGRNSTISVTNAAATLTISGAAASTNGSLTKSGAGTLTLTGNNLHSGNTTVAAGTLLLSGAGTLGTSTISISGGTLDMGGKSLTNLFGSLTGGTLSNGTLTNNGSNYDLQSGTVSAVLAGTNGVNKTTSGTVTLTGNNTFTGTTTLGAGTLQVGHASALGASGNITFSGGTMQFASGGNGADYGSRIKNSASAIILDTNTNNVTFSSAIDSSNTAGLTKNGTGTLALSGANSYTGGTAINEGTLQVGDANALGTSGNITFSGGTMSFSSTGAGADYGARIKNSASAMVFDTNGQSVTLGAIDNSNANGLTKNGSGTLTLSGANTYTGATTINGGTLTLSGGLNNSSVTVNGGLLNQTSTGSIAGTGTTFTLTTGNATLAGTNTYTGATTVNGGTLSVLGSVASSATTVNNEATLTGNGTTGAITIASGGSINPGVGVGTINTGGITLIENSTYNWQLWKPGGAAGSDWDLINSTGALTFGAGSNLTINLLTVSDQAGTAGQAFGFVNTQNYSWRLAEFGSDISGLNPNFLILNSTGFQNQLSPSGSFSLETSGNFLNLLYTTTLTSYTYTAGTGSWSTTTNWTPNGTPTSANPLTFNGTGGTSTNDFLSSVQNLVIASSAGSYTLAGSGNGSTITLDGGITNGSSNNQTISMGINLGNDQLFTSDAGNLILSGALGTSNRTLTVTGAGNVSITNTISGSGNLTKTGTGTLTLDGSNTYTGATTINGGTLTLNGGLNNSSVTVNGGLLNQTSTGSIAGTGTTFTLTSGNATLAGTNTYTGATTLNGGTLTLSGGLNNSSVTVNGGLLNQTSTGSIAGTGTTFTLTTGNATLSGNNTYAGATTVNGGTLEIASTGRLGGSSYGGNISNNGTFIYSGTNNQTLSGIISGTGALTQNNSVSTLTLAGSNTYTGATTISAGTLQIGAGSTTGSLSTSSAITNNGALSFNRSNTITQGTDFASVISGTGNLIQAGSGNLVLSGNNTYTGSTTISAGTLEIASAGRLGGGNYSQNITNNGVFLYSGTNNQTLSGIISGTGALTHNTTGGNTTTLTLTGNNTYTGNTTVSAGILNIQHANALGGSANGTTVASGAVLQLQGGINIASEALTLNGSGVNFGGALINSSGNNEWAGNITIGSATTRIQAKTGTTLTISGNITNNAGAALHFQGPTGANIIVSGIISGNGSLNTNTNDFPVSLTLSGNNTYTGKSVLNSGTISINSIKDVGAGASSLGAPTTTANGQIDLGSGTGGIVTLRYTGSGDSSNRTINLISTTANQTIDQSGTGTLRFTSNFTATGAGSKTLILQGSTAGIGEIAGAVVNNNSTNTTSLTKNGTGTWILSGANTYTGATTINAGTLQIGNGSSTGSLSASSAITNNGTLVFNRSGIVTQGTDFANSISGSGNLTQAGSGTLALGGTNTYTGLTTISAGNLSISSATALNNTSGVNLANATALIYTGGVGDLTRNISVTGGTGSTGTIRNDGGALTLSGALTKNGTTLALQGGSGGITVSGVISGSSNNSDLVIDGGTTTLTNANNSYNGPTFIINGGTLNANTAGALPTSTLTAVTINGSSTLALGASQSIASLTGAASSNVTLGSNTLTIGTASGNTTYAGRITGGSTSALVKDGASTQVLTGDNTGFTGTTTINGTGTLQAAAAGALGGTTNIDVNGGSLLVAVANAVNSNANINLGGGTLAVSGNFNQNVGALTLSADSVIDLEGFSGILRFSGLSWASGASNAKLAIWNWSGTPQHGPPVNDYTNPSHVVFANNANLTAENLAKISFYSGGNNSGFIGNAFAQSFSDPSFSGTEIIAVPEPETYLTGVILLLGGIIYLRRQAKHREGHRPAWPKFLLGSRETTPAHHPAPKPPKPHPARMSLNHE
jgi:autotransporter-associated beta strand protein